MNEQRRLFFALWPDSETRRALARHGASLPPGGRPVTAANLHMTLAFLGAVPATALPAIRAIGEQMLPPRLELLLDHTGYWSGPRVLWLGPESTPLALNSLVDALRDALAARQLPVDQRPWLPHVSLRRQLRTHPGSGTGEPVRWPVSGFSLLESLSTPSGVVYRPLASWR